jgi:uncharacterized small protein (DUF1192 family)
MLDRELVVHHTAAVREVLKTRGVNAAHLLDGFEELNTQRKATITLTENLRARKNVISDEIPKLKKAKEPADHLIAESKEIGVQIDTLEKELKRLEATVDEILETLPNLPQGHLERVLVAAMPDEEKSYFRLLYILAGQDANGEAFEIDGSSCHLPQDVMNNVMAILIHGDYNAALKRIAVLDAEYERIMAEIEA